MSSVNKPVSVAILDDYQNVATAIFSARLQQRIEVQSFPDTLNVLDPEQRDELVKRLYDFQVVSTMRERTAFSSEVVESLPNLKLILTTGTRNASISIPACKDRGILVIGTDGKRIQKESPPEGTLAIHTSLQSTVEQTIALILAVSRLVPQHHISIAQGKWQTGFATGLCGKTLGLVGLGRLGAAVARIAHFAFGMKIIAWSSSLTQEKADKQAEELGLPISSIVVVSKLELFQRADVVSLHYVLSERSRKIVGRSELEVLKRTAILINTSRGGLIDEPELLRVLKEGRIHGVGLDVFTVEPLPTDSEWRTTRWGENGTSHAVLSPHMGYADGAVIRGWYEESAENLEEWLDGKTPGTSINE